MQPPRQHSRVNLAELKAQIIRKLGPERSKQYFGYLNRLMSLKLGKVEFNKLCVRIVGRENIPLHNNFIRSILKNAFTPKSPPPTQNVEFLKQKGTVRNDGSLPNGSHSSITLVPNPTNGDILHTVLGPNWKPSAADVILENGETTPRVQHHQGTTRSSNGPLSVHSNDQQDSLVRSLLRAPLGIPYCRGARRPLPGGSNFLGALNCGGLLDTVTLRDRMEQIAASHGLKGVSIDCANALNNGLDAYLKGLIRSTFDLVRAQPGPDTTSCSLKQQNHSKLVNGFRQGHQFLVQSSSGRSISPLDFRVAMELNPQQLGDDWPFLFEKIGSHLFEE